MKRLGPKTRVFLIVGVLAIAALGAGMLLLNRNQSSGEASPGTTAPQIPRGRLTLTTTGPTATTPRPAAAPTTSTPAGASQAGAAPVAPRPKARAAAAATQPGERLPAAIQQGLSANRVVVVALYDPTAKIDGTALREAQAGAQLAGTTFVPIDVTKNDVDALNARYGVIQDPAVLVLRPPGDLVVRIDGFADRDTVAQAAANAAS